MTTASSATICFRLACGCLLVSVAACGNTPEPQHTEPTNRQMAKVITMGAGYVHTANKSRFHLGANPSPKSEFGFAKLVGSEGVFGTVPETGWVMGIPNAGASSMLADPLTQSPDVHNKTVVDYFVGAGLPADQIKAVNAHASVQGSGSGPGAMSNGEFAGYTSVITRAVAGIPVPDSFAWARFNANGEAVEEQVFWPTIPSDVIQQAQALQATVSDPQQGASFLNKLPSKLAHGQVVIRHSPGSQRSLFECVASYDMMEMTPMGRVRHFDSTGAEFQLAGETKVVP